MKKNQNYPYKLRSVPGLKTGLCCFIIVIVFSLFQTSCDKDYFFQKKIEISNGQWAYSDTLNYQFSISDTLETYNLYLDFEYADTFSNQNVYIKLHTLFPDGKRLSKQKSFDLFDSQGKPFGECSGRKCQIHMLLQEKAFFNSAGAYTITLEQYTRENPLPGILSVGLAIEPTGVRR